MMPANAIQRIPNVRTTASLAGVLLWLFLLSFGALAQDSAGKGADATGQASYQLGPGDRLQIDVFNHSDLSGQFVLDGTGRFSMPLIGPVDASGLTGAELEDLLISRLKPDYLVNPRVSVSVEFYRPYYMMGEVGRTGTFPYVEDMTYLQAIAIAGGYSYRAKKDVVYVVRANDDSQNEVKLDVNERVQPGDIIRVAERIF
jgi:polysaccharide export outer membrane protein